MALLFGVLAAALASLASLSTVALAGQGVFVTVHNKSSAWVTLVGTDGSNCWEAQGLVHDLEQNYVAPGGERTYTSEKKTGGGCKGSDGHQRVQFMVKDFKEATEGGRWYLPGGSPPGYSLYWQDGGNENFGLNFYNGLSTWVPRTDGKGLICMHAEVKNENFGDVWIYGDERCNEAVPATIQRTSPKPKPRITGDPPPPEDKAKIVDVLSMVGVACGWYAYPKEPGVCQSLGIGNEANWVLDNVKAEIRKFNVTGEAGAKDQKAPVGTRTAEVQDGPGAKPLEISVSKTVETEEQNETTTERGFKLGAKLGFAQKATAKIPFFSEGEVEFSQEISGEFNYGSTSTAKTSKREKIETSIKSIAEPGFVTTLEVFTTTRNAKYTYEADLSLGLDGVGQNVTTPASVALGQSPSLRQPCLAYAIGSGRVRNSIVNTGEALIAAGNKPDDSSLPIEKRAFLGAVGSFKTGSKPCPGFPYQYASEASFNGKGVGSYSNLGYDANGRPVSEMIACLFVRPIKKAKGPAPRAAATRARLAEASAVAAPCQSVKPDGGKVDPPAVGLLIDARDRSDAVASKGNLASGTRGSDRILGPAGGGTVRTGGGAFDVVKAGKGDTRVFATSREAALFGNAGDDVLVGGRGMHYMHGGKGGDRLVDSRGAAIMYGEGGDDVFEANGMRGVIFGGRGGDEVVASGDLSRLATSGEGGDDVYRLAGSGVPSIVEFPGGGEDTLLTDRSFELPVNIEVGRAVGPRRVTLHGGEPRQLIAGPRGGVLVSGPGPTWLRGRGGADKFVFDAENGDTATGGAGGDRYVFTGTPVTMQRPAGLRYPDRRFAAVVSDFEPDEGDRLEMRGSVFGRQVLRLQRRFLVVADAKPRPGRRAPTLLLDTDSGVVSFDRDGKGPISDKVVVTLPGRQDLERGWFVFRR